VAAVEYRKTCVFWQLAQPTRQKIVGYVPGHVEVSGGETFIKSILFITITINFLNTMTGEVQKEESGTNSEEHR